MIPDFGERWASALRYIVCTGWLHLSCLTAFAQPPALASEPVKQHLIVIVGAPGTEEYRTRFDSWATRWKVAADRADAG